MCKTLTLTILLTTAILLTTGPAGARTIHYPPAMQKCAAQMNAAIRLISHLRHDPALDATPAARATRVKVEELVVRDTHILASIFHRLQHDATFRRGPAGTRDVCLLSRAYQADAHVLMRAIRAGRAARRAGPARPGGGAEAGVAGLLPQSDQAAGGPGPLQYTHTFSSSRTLTNTRQHSERAERSKTRSRTNSSTRTRSHDYSRTSSTRAGDTQSVGASRSVEITTTQSIACPPAGCPTSLRGMEMDGECGSRPGQLDCRAYFHRPLRAPSAAGARRIVAQGRAAAQAARASTASSPLTHPHP